MIFFQTSNNWFWWPLRHF